MKKILLLFILLITVVITPEMVKANSTNILKKLYIVEGSEDTLDYPGFMLVETNINYNIAGNYTAKYKEDITDRIFTREIEVITTDTLLNAGIKNVNLLEEKTFPNKQVLKRINTTDIEVYILADDTTIYLAYLYYDGLSYFDEFERTEYSFVDAVFDVDTNQLYFVCNIMEDSLNIYTAIYALNGERTYDKIIRGNNVDIISNICVDNNNLYLCGNTKSSDGDFMHTAYQEDSFVISLDKKNLDNLNYLNLGEQGIDYISSCINSAYLYVIKHMYLHNVHVVKIIKLDENLNIMSEVYLGTMTQVQDIALKEYQGDLYYFCHLYDENYLDSVTALYKITSDLSIKLIDKYYDYYSIGKDLNITNGEISLLYTTYDQNENYPTFLRIVGNPEKRINLDNRIYSNLYFNDLGNLDLIYADKIKSYEYVYIYAKTLGSHIFSEEVHPQILYNNITVNPNEYLSNLYFNENQFGNYTLNYYYNFEFFDLAIKKNLIVDDGIIVEDNNIYNTNLCLKFNGTATLNNKVIESGYIIQTPGSYELVITGYQNQKHTYLFEVVELSNNHNNKQKEHIDFDTTYEESKPLEEISIHNNPVENNIIQKDYSSNLWYILLPIISLIIAVSTFTFIGRKIK